MVEQQLKMMTHSTLGHVTNVRVWGRGSRDRNGSGLAREVLSVTGRFRDKGGILVVQVVDGPELNCWQSERLAAKIRLCWADVLCM